jgi:hypothetical protein
MGSNTVLFEAGARNQLDLHGEDRFDAYVAISPSGPGSIFSAGSWSGIHKPLYLLTGTRNRGIEGDWHWRTRPYEGLPAGSKWLGVVDGATHLNFAGIGFSGKTEKLTVMSVAALLDGVRKGRCTLPPGQAGITLNGK